MGLRIGVNTRLLKGDKLDGIGRFTHEIFKRVVQQHPEHEFVFFFDHEPNKRFIYANNVTPVRVYPPTKHVYVFDTYFNIRLHRKIKKYDLDLFISPDGILSMKSNVPQISVIHDLNFEHHPEWLPRPVAKYYRNRFSQFAKKAARIVTVSEFSKTDIAQTYHIAQEKIGIVHNAAIDAFKPMEYDDQMEVKKEFSGGRPYFLFVGSIHPRKNICGLLHAYEQFRKQHDSHVKLVIAGKKTWWTPEMEETLTVHPFKKDIILTGAVEEDDLHRLMASALALVYIPHYEGFGIPILEAMQSGVPVITSNVTSLPEVAGDAGLVVEHGNIKATAEAMMHVSESVQLRNRLIESGLKRASEFNWDHSSKEMWNNIKLALDAAKTL